LHSPEKLKRPISGWLSKLKWVGRRTNRKGKRLTFAPYPLSIYQRLLKNLSMDDQYVICNLEDYSDRAKENRVHILIRHDIDTLDCLRKMEFLLEEDLKHGFRPAVYLRVDEEAYSLREWKGLIGEYHSRGVPFGLHSVCYVHRNYLDIFQKETQAFIRETGIVPKSFTLHGLGDYGIENRSQFIKQAKQIVEDHGYDITDCSTDFISYEYVIHDSHWDAANQKRYALEEFIHLPKCLKGKAYLILTHPCYWRSEIIKTPMGDRG
jgi:hypothetical protein